MVVRTCAGFRRKNTKFGACVSGNPIGAGTRRSPRLWANQFNLCTCFYFSTTNIDLYVAYPLYVLEFFFYKKYIYVIIHKNFLQNVFKILEATSTFLQMR